MNQRRTPDEQEQRLEPDTDIVPDAQDELTVACSATLLKQLLAQEQPTVVESFGNEPKTMIWPNGLIPGASTAANEGEVTRLDPPQGKPRRHPKSSASARRLRVCAIAGLAALIAGCVVAGVWWSRRQTRARGGAPTHAAASHPSSSPLRASAATPFPDPPRTASARPPVAATHIDPPSVRSATTASAAHALATGQHTEALALYRTLLHASPDAQVYVVIEAALLRRLARECEQIEGAPCP